MRPNIRVEIQNTVEAMEVDENEEGEISETEETSTANDVDFQAQEAQATNIEDKLQERARRFQLNPAEIKNFKDEDIKLLHCTLGITPNTEPNVRFEVIHMRGIKLLTAGDILDYFLEYAPVSIEWIDEESCNVVWSDKVSSSRALHFMSKPVRGMPVRDDSSYFENIHEEVDQSVLLLNKNREIELKEDEDPLSQLLNDKNSADISEITTTIPPGYWRLGKRHQKGNCLLLRFALKTDKKSVKVEQFTRYYTNKKAKQTHGIFGRNKDMRKEKNPWTTLARNWDEDRPFREPERDLDIEPKLDAKNPLRSRLGMKRKEEEEADEETAEAPKKKSKVPRMRMYADEEEEKIKQRLMLKKINRQIKKIDADKADNSDLRTILNMTNRTQGVKIERTEPETFDLGTTLKNRNKKMVFQIKREREEQQRYERYSRPGRERQRRYSSEEEEEDVSYRKEYGDKPRSKVAVVIKTQKKPTVASAVGSSVLSRIAKSRSASPESESASSESESEETEEMVEERAVNRPGFSAGAKDTFKHATLKNPLKIEINNDHFKRS